MSELDRWTPRLRGLKHGTMIYCSPACGAGCTKAAFDKATAQAEALAAKLGKNWKPRVKENCQWYWSVTLKAPGVEVEIHPAECSDTFWADMRLHGDQYHAHGKTAQAALAAALKIAQEKVAGLDTALCMFMEVNR